MATKKQLFNKLKGILTEYSNFIGKPVLLAKSEDDYYKSHTSVDIEIEIKRCERKLLETKKLAKADEWKKTEEGSSYFNDIDERFKELKRRNEEIFCNTKNGINIILHAEVGDDWDIDFNESYSSIGIVKGYWDNGVPQFKFGHTFELHYDLSYDRQTDTEKFELNMNYGTLGSFSLTDDKDASRIELLNGMAKFLQPDVIKEVKEYLYEFVTENSKLGKEFIELEKKRNNPPIFNGDNI